MIAIQFFAKFLLELVDFGRFQLDNCMRVTALGQCGFNFRWNSIVFNQKLFENEKQEITIWIIELLQFKTNRTHEYLPRLQFLRHVLHIRWWYFCNGSSWQYQHQHHDLFVRLHSLQHFSSFLDDLLLGCCCFFHVIFSSQKLPSIVLDLAVWINSIVVDPSIAIVR